LAFEKQHAKITRLLERVVLGVKPVKTPTNDRRAERLWPALPNARRKLLMRP